MSYIHSLCILKKIKNMNKSIIKLIPTAVISLEKFFADSPDPKIISPEKCCHLGVRCANRGQYDEIISELKKAHKITSRNETVVNNRDISVVKFSERSLEIFKFPYLEISDQKPDNSQSFGIDHAEFVYTNEIPFDESSSYIWLIEKGSTIKPKERRGYKNFLWEVTLPDGFTVLFSQGEFLWEKIVSEFSPSK